MDAREIIFNYFDDVNMDLHSLMDYLDTDTLVGWFVDEDYISGLDDEEQEIVQHHYDLHC